MKRAFEGRNVDVASLGARREGAVRCKNSCLFNTCAKNAVTFPCGDCRNTIRRTRRMHCFFVCWSTFVRVPRFVSDGFDSVSYTRRFCFSSRGFTFGGYFAWFIFKSTFRDASLISYDGKFWLVF